MHKGQQADLETHDSQYIAVVKGDGCAAKETVDRELVLTIPLEDIDKHRAVSKVTLDALGNPTTAYVYNQFTPSVTSRMLRVDYSIKCFVKYDSWEARGEGKVVTLPIKIYQNPQPVKVPFQLSPIAGFDHYEEAPVSFV